MAYTVPTFNLLCNVWSGTVLSPPGLPLGAPRLALLPCSLRVGRINEGQAPVYMQLAVVKRTDLRPEFLAGGRPDNVEVPAGSGRFYQVTWVDDVGRGFANEYRLATLYSQPFLVAWPVPIS